MVLHTAQVHELLKKKKVGGACPPDNNKHCVKWVEWGVH